ncbi:MAG: aminotransferase class V-fold PLP-dependent enzyme [Candidatus Dormiibacterota bacterium]
MTPAAARALYPVFKTRAYLNAGTCGPLADATVAALTRSALEELERGRSGTDRIERYFDLQRRIQSGVGSVIGVDPSRVAITSSTTEGCNIALAAMRLGADDEVVTTDNEHPGVTAPLAKCNAQVRVAEVLHHAASEALDRILAQVTPRTRLIALSHVGWLNGQVLPVLELKRATGLPVLVDGAQSAGAIPVQAADVDFYTVSCQKWLCAPDGTGALYVRDPEKLEPGLGGYMTVHGEGVDRFQIAHHAIPTLEAWVTALDLHPEWRYQRAAELSALAREQLSQRFDVVTEADQSTLVSFVAPGEPLEVTARLAERGVIVRDLPGTPWIRISCGYWNDESDIDRLVKAFA